ncbi:clathrin light chain 1-like [Hordeum vulgare subsp. vulgare]|uniref:clathrin light chain 1-like n=1 Tax=Hordeum vulgare subsp. vulgare TaxID=112509 RepID=UPI001D1A4F17|nr:clathrin light chain 1-like [Hordeum vulgare subsp. vulgare]
MPLVNDDAVAFVDLSYPHENLTVPPSRPHLSYPRSTASRAHHGPLLRRRRRQRHGRPPAHRLPPFDDTEDDTTDAVAADGSAGGYTSFVDAGYTSFVDAGYPSFADAGPEEEEEEVVDEEIAADSDGAAVPVRYVSGGYAPSPFFPDSDFRGGDDDGPVLPPLAEMGREEGALLCEWRRELLKKERLKEMETRKIEVEQKTAAAAEDSDKSESKKVSSDNKENNSEKVDSSDRKEGSSESKEDSSETKAEGDKEAFIDLRPLTMEDLRQAKNQVAVSFAAEGAVMNKLKQWFHAWPTHTHQQPQKAGHFPQVHKFPS